MTTVSQLGDARTGKLADNLSGFGRTLRRAGVCVDAARMAPAQPKAIRLYLEPAVSVGVADTRVVPALITCEAVAPVLLEV